MGVFMAAQGMYKPRYPEKYLGDPDEIRYRSSWELQFMRDLDLNHNVLKWGSEEIVIPYIKPTDKRVHKYIPDFVVVCLGEDGQVHRYLIEIKPYKEAVLTKKSTTRDKLSILVNHAKWEAAKSFAENNGMVFKVLTENELYGDKK